MSSTGKQITITKGNKRDDGGQVYFIRNEYYPRALFEVKFWYYWHGEMVKKICRLDQGQSTVVVADSEPGILQVSEMDLKHALSKGCNDPTCTCPITNSDASMFTTLGIPEKRLCFQCGHTLSYHGYVKQVQ